MLRYRTVRTRRKNEVTVLELGPDDGNGKAPVLLVHPVNLRKECWLDLMCGLLGDRRCVAVDLAGHGESSDSEGYSLDGWVSDCRDVVTSLDLDRYHLVGGSAGGTIALCLAGELPTRAMSVTTMGSSIRYEPDPAAGPEPDIMLGAGTVGEMFDRLSVQGLAPGSPGSLVATARHLANAHGESVVRAILTAVREADATAWLGAVECPVLVLAGEYDRTGALGASERMARQIGGRYKVLPNVGHLPMVEDVPAVLELLIPHLDTAESVADRS